MWLLITLVEIEGCTGLTAVVVVVVVAVAVAVVAEKNWE